MGLFLNNHIGLLKNKLRFSDKPTLKYLKTTVTKKLKSFHKPLNHYQRFAQEPHFVEVHYPLMDLPDDYGLTLRVVGDIFNVKVLYRYVIYGPFEISPTALLVGTKSDVDLASRMLNLCI